MRLKSYVFLIVRRSADMGIFRLSPRDHLAQAFQPAIRVWWRVSLPRRLYGALFVSVSIEISCDDGLRSLAYSRRTGLVACRVCATLYGLSATRTFSKLRVFLVFEAWSSRPSRIPHEFACGLSSRPPKGATMPITAAPPISAGSAIKIARHRKLCGMQEHQRTKTSLANSFSNRSLGPQL